ncbi:hypothetical protein BGZ58_007220 [Dissophora ornata]|nr:hypothetical protein BGZ58_007220 [Dissophora ornata]
MIGLARRLVRTTGSWTPRHIGDSLSKVNLAAVLPWSSSYGQLLQNPSAEELSALAVLSLAGLSVAGLYWDPLDFVAQKAPQTRIKTRRYYPWLAAGSPAPLPVSSRQSARASDNFMFSTSPSSLEFPASRPGSPDINEINWSPRKPSSAASVRPPAAFGMYRDSNHADEQEGISFQASSRPGSAGSAYGQQNVRSAPSIDNRFHARAYEPSPLANPSLITNMGLSNMSLGEMFGFPSAKFQPPENHFAHRSTRQNREQGMDAWSYRKAAGSGGLNPTRSTDHRASAPAPSRFSGGADVDMDDDEEAIVGWSSGLDWICQAVYVGVMLHATAFWILDEYRAVRRYFEKKHEPANKKSPAAADPFDPTTMDKLSSVKCYLATVIDTNA